MNIFELTIDLPPFTPVLERQNGYYIEPTEATVTITPTTATTTLDTPDWCTDDEEFYDNRATTYTWSNVVLTKEDKRRAAFNEAVYLANKQRLHREQVVAARAAQELAMACSNPSHIIQICDWV